MTRITTLIAAASVALVPFAANAQEVRTAEVYFNDLDLTTAAGQSTLDTRINAAVRKVCGVSMDRNSLREEMDQRQCVEKARGDVTVLAAKHSSRTLAAK